MLRLNLAISSGSRKSGAPIVLPILLYKANLIEPHIGDFMYKRIISIILLYNTCSTCYNCVVRR